MKLSTDKTLYPGVKQVFRISEGEGFSHDVIARADEDLAGEALLVPVMRDGRRLAAGRRSLEEIREATRDKLAHLPERLLAIDPAEEGYRVEVSRALERDLDELAESLEQSH